MKTSKKLGKLNINKKAIMELSTDKPQDMNEAEQQQVAGGVIQYKSYEVSPCATYTHGWSCWDDISC